MVNRPSQTVVADPEVADNRDVVRRLSTVLGLPANVVLQRINDAAAGAQSLRVVGEDVRLRDVAFIAEHADAFPGITVEERSQREYPYGALAAHVLGYTSMATPESLENQAAGRDVLAIDTIAAPEWRPPTTRTCPASTARARSWWTPTAGASRS